MRKSLREKVQARNENRAQPPQVQEDPPQGAVAEAAESLQDLNLSSNEDNLRDKDSSQNSNSAS